MKQMWALKNSKIWNYDKLNVATDFQVNCVEM
jgi:hypothetical protein